MGGWLPQGWQRRLGRYLGVGVVNTVVGYVTICLAMWLGAAPIPANVLGYALGFVCSFTLNRNWTFTHRGPVRRSLPRFVLVCAVGYAVNLLVLVALQQLGVNIYLAQLLAMGCYTAVTFGGSLLYAFSKPEGEKPDATT